LDVEFGGEIKETVWDSFHAVFEEYLFWTANSRHLRLHGAQFSELLAI
jgi:hypothetical protein